MISICIPLHNTPVVSLVHQLAKQAATIPHPVEIVILDDASSSSFQRANSEVNAIHLVSYHTNPDNKGRTFTRSRLASLAAHPWLLYLDADSTIINENFLVDYLPHLSDPNRVITGGRVYASVPPADCRLMLHWKYGTARENKWREKNPGNIQGFQSNNFLVHKDVFTSLVFPEELSGYGHEDTWMGMELERQGRRVLHINNPVLHNRLEPAEAFLEKSRLALNNLHRLSKTNDEALLKKHVKIYRTYNKWKAGKMLGVITAIYSIFNKLVQNNLRSCSPGLFFFDLYRLNYLIKIFR